MLAYAILTGGIAFTRPGALHHPYPLIAVAQLVGACGEEICWRCLLQPQLRTRFGPIAASVAVGVLWGVWRVQVFAQAPAYAAMFLLATVSMSVVLGLALEHAGAYRLPLAGGFHALARTARPCPLEPTPPVRAAQRGTGAPDRAADRHPGHGARRPRGRT